MYYSLACYCLCYLDELITFYIVHYCFLTSVVFFIVFLLQDGKDVEQAQEAELRAKYPNFKCPGTSALLQKRLSKGVSFDVLNYIIL